MKKILLIYLEGYLQSYGESSKWSYRDTSQMPTKSAVVGLIACAMGLPRGSKEITELSKSLRIGVRADRQGKILKEYQTITGQLLNSNGEKLYTNKEGRTTRSSVRYYLQDSSFLVVIEAVEEGSSILEDIEKALRSPKWQIYLGRKNCVPSRPIMEKISEDYKDIEDAVMNYKLDDRHDKGPIKYQIESTYGNIVRYDETLSETGQKYGRRTIIQGIK